MVCVVDLGAAELALCFLLGMVCNVKNDDVSQKIQKAKAVSVVSFSESSFIHSVKSLVRGLQFTELAVQ